MSENSTLVDDLSTSLLIMGKNQAVNYWKKHKIFFIMVLLDESGDLYVTEVIADQFISEHNIRIIKM